MTGELRLIFTLKDNEAFKVSPDLSVRPQT